MTPNKEDYLKALFQLSVEDELVSNKQIAEALQIAPASVTEMLIKLQREELIYYEPYKGSRLTAKGMAVATSLVRGHRLWEVFLTRHLGYSWSEAHEDAELLEHITPPRLTARLDEYLNFPAYSPHGHAIPQPDGQIDRTPLETLDHLPVGITSYISRVREDKSLMDCLQEKGIAIGSSVQIVEAADEGGYFLLDLDGKNVQISRQAAGQIFVEQIHPV
ncbi:MAG: metal-dependent transcriptional regulator [Clostridiales bacterium]|nr:metal-dependent transcriptional regulator [Clostridiales bacterium]